MSGIETLQVGPTDLIILRLDALPEGEVDSMIQTLHKHFPSNMILMLDKGETIEARPEEEIKGLLQALIEHQDYREHKDLAEGMNAP